MLFLCGYYGIYKKYKELINLYFRITACYPFFNPFSAQ